MPNQIAAIPLNIIALQKRANCLTIKTEPEDDIHIHKAPTMKQLCIQVPYTTSPANPIWTQDIMRAKAGTSDG